MLKYKIIVALFVLLVLAVIADKVVFSTFTVAVQRRPEKIFVSSASPVTVRVVPLNRLGFDVPFDKLKGKFVVQDGADKIQVVKVEKDMLMFTTRAETGRVVLLYYASNLAFPIEIVLRIQSSAVADLMCLPPPCA